MREILFRGKCNEVGKYNGHWIEGHYGEDEGRNEIFFSTKIGIVGYSCEPESIGQYTGLTDKNGKKIFEGDIVRTHYANAPKAVFVETVIFDGGKFCATSINEGCKTTAALWDGVPRLAIDKSVYMDEVEIIGNIHDNPELLEEKE